MDDIQDITGPAAHTRSRTSANTATVTTTAPAITVTASTPISFCMSTSGTPQNSPRLVAGRGRGALLRLFSPSPVDTGDHGTEIEPHYQGTSSGYQSVVQMGMSMGLKGTDLVDFVERRIHAEDEMKRLEIETRRAEAEIQLHSHRARTELETRKIETEAQVKLEELRLQQAHLDKSRSGSKDSDDDAEFEKVKLRMPFYDDKEDLESFLSQFERLASLQKWHKNTWAVRLATLLRGKARDVYVGLTDDQASDYETVKKALLTRFQLTSESYRKKFRSSRRDQGESYMQFLAKLRLWLKRWMSLAKKGETFEGLTDLILTEQLLDGLPTELSTFIREREPSNVDQAATLAQQYADARESWRGKPPKRDNPVMRDEPGPTQNDGSGTTRNSVSPNQSRKKRCYVCHQEGHFQMQCPNRPKNTGAVTVCSTPGSTATNLVSRGAGPKYDVMINGKLVTGIRDTGAEIICVRDDLVPKNATSIKTVSLKSFTSDVLQVNVVVVDLACPFISGRMEVAVVPNLCKPVLLGNMAILVDGRQVTLPLKPVEEDDKSAIAVVTRAGAKNQDTEPAPLRMQTQATLFSRTDLQQAQKDDPALGRLRGLADSSSEEKAQGKGKVKFLWFHGVLCREYRDKEDVSFRQIVVPKALRKDLLIMAHDIPTAGHLGAKKTQDRVWVNFYWPGMCADIRRYCQSCDVCQRTVPRGRTKRVPLGTMPLSVVPFQRVAADLVGPLHPASVRGHRFILVVVDLATRYPEAVPLRHIDTTTIAEALWQIWTRIGVPERILTDRGAQFTSDKMKEVNRLLAIHGHTTTPYHAQCNGVVERFNGTLKGMIRRLCIDQPAEWDRYLPALLFAYREVPHSSSGFSPFELLYGRTVRGPLQIMRQLWLNEEINNESMTAAEYVVELRNRIADSCERAQEHLDVEAFRQRQIKDRSSENRTFASGDKVLLLRPQKENKLELAWQGPFEVIERVGNCDYRIKMGQKTKLFHANLLRQYIQRQEEISTQEMAVVVMEEEDPDVIMKGNVPVVPLTNEESVKDINLGPKLSEQQCQEIRNECEQVSEFMVEKPKRTSLASCHLALTSDTPVHVRQYPLPFAKIEQIKKEVQEMVELGVIEPAVSPYNAPIVLVRKKDGKTRFCVDYRKLNLVLQFDAEPIPDVEYLFSKLAHARFLSKLDLSRGYWQIPMLPEDKVKTAFTTPLGQYQWTVMPFGLKTAGAVFSRMMRALLEPLGRKDIDNFIDDILIASQSWSEHIDAIRTVLQRIRQANLSVRPSKCFFGFDEVEYLGFHIGHGKVRPEDEKVDRIKNAPIPTSKTEIRSFLGTTGFYRRFVPGYAEISAPLTDLLKKGKSEKVVWNEEAENAFCHLKECLSSAPIMVLADVALPFVLRTDASDKAIGAVLLQDQGNGLQPIHYASRKLRAAERNYAVVEKECLAVVWGVAKFETYLYGNKFVVESDHQPLKYIQQAKLSSGRLARWALQLQQYDFSVKVIPGIENVGADFLSRSGIDSPV